MSDRPGRLLSLVHLLNGRRPRSVPELARYFDTSERTIFRDLATLDERHIPIYRDDRGYRLLETARLPTLNFTAEERAVLRLALDNPLLRRRTSLRKTLRSLEAKLEAATVTLAETPEALALASLDRTGGVDEGIVETVREAIESKHTIDVLYASLSGGKQRRRRLDPYRLVHRGDAWYLPSHCHRNRELRLFRLDRVRSVRLLDQRFTIPEDFDVEALFEDSWTVFLGSKRHRIVLHFDAAIAPLLESACHHAGEEIQELVGGGLEYRVTLSHLDELARWVVGFGGMCRVVEPQALRETVESLARGVLDEG